uniref:SFRICE_026004 n=1 Tax=Spodoptera frugiperda TaxID=7108 RepID=A0A2H1WXJ4_SPOFR
MKMRVKCLVTFFCAVAYFVGELDAQICRHYELVTSMKQVTYPTSYRVTYQGRCYFKRCILTKWMSSVERKSIPRRELKPITSCCPGYIRKDDSADDRNIVCEAICMPACRNGRCKNPGICECNNGYIADPKDDHNCLPFCEKGCEHGTCVAPGTCRCDFGYTLVNGTCQPVCTDPCHNGTCVAPEQCECLVGYRKSETNICQPYCSHGCDNGACVAPETCQCHSGWDLKETENFPYKHCVPVCSKPCGNGTCVAPNVCACHRGYEIDINYNSLYTSNPNATICVPNCTGCAGRCIAPNKCELILTSESQISYYDEYSYDYDAPLLPKFYPTPAKTTTSTTRTTSTAAPYPIPTTTSTATPYSIPTTTSTATPYPVPTTTSTATPYPIPTTTSTAAPYPVPTTTSTATPYPIPTTTSTATPYPLPTTTSTATPYPLPTRTSTATPYPVPTTTSTMATATSTMGASSYFNETNGEELKKSWIEENWVHVFVPMLVVITTAMIAVLLLVWRCTPIRTFFKGRSYVVEGDPVQTGNPPPPSENIRISDIKI